jgi:hypothetical protein
MDWEIFHKKISNIERFINISGLKCFEFNPWPYIRLLLLDKWRDENIELDMNQTKKSKNKFFNILVSFLQYIKNPILKKDVDIIYFSHFPWSKVFFEGKHFDKNADSFWYFFSKDYKIKNIELGSEPEVEGELYFKKNTTYIDFILSLARVEYKILSYFKSQKFFLFKNLDEAIVKNFGFKVQYCNELSYIYFLSKKLEKVLYKYNPKAVFLGVFYSPNSMAISLACHRLGIQVVEYQHGAPNKTHPMYSHWENIPHQGYELIPDIFWTWGKSSQKVVQAWMKYTKKHKAIIGGNLWMGFYRKNAPTLNREDTAVIYNKDKVNILVSLQGDQFFPYYLLESIKDSVNSIDWHFRDHPTLLISDGLKEKLSSFSNTEIEYSSRAPLYNLFGMIDIHITSFSTVAFEAQSFNIPTIFTHVNAKNGYRSLLSKNGLYYAASSAELNLLIDKLLQSTDTIKSENIVSDLDVYKNTLALIMGNL